MKINKLFIVSSAALAVSFFLQGSLHTSHWQSIFKNNFIVTAYADINAEIKSVPSLDGDAINQLMVGDTIDFTHGKVFWENKENGITIQSISVKYGTSVTVQQKNQWDTTPVVKCISSGETRIEVNFTDKDGVNHTTGYTINVSDSASTIVDAYHESVKLGTRMLDAASFSNIKYGSFPCVETLDTCSLFTMPGSGG